MKIPLILKASGGHLALEKYDRKMLYSVADGPKT